MTASAARVDGSAERTELRELLHDRIGPQLEVHVPAIRARLPRVTPDRVLERAAHGAARAGRNEPGHGAADESQRDSEEQATDQSGLEELTQLTQAELLGRGARLPSTSPPMRASSATRNGANQDIEI